MRTLIQNGTLVRSQGIEQADILVENGFIKRIAAGITEQADEVINAGGKLVFAGFIDTHTHFDLDLGVTVTADNRLARGGARRHDHCAGLCNTGSRHDDAGCARPLA